jgi:hypothetical protein
MKIVAILIVMYFGLGFFGTGLILERIYNKPRKPQAITAETPPYQLPLIILLASGLLALPLYGYRRAAKQGKFIHIGPKFWLWGPPLLLSAGVLTAFATAPLFLER